MPDFTGSVCWTVFSRDLPVKTTVPAARGGISFTSTELTNWFWRVPHLVLILVLEGTSPGSGTGTVLEGSSPQPDTVMNRQCYREPRRILTVQESLE